MLALLAAVLIGTPVHACVVYEPSGPEAVQLVLTTRETNYVDENCSGWLVPLLTRHGGGYWRWRPVPAAYRPPRLICRLTVRDGPRMWLSIYDRAGAYDAAKLCGSFIAGGAWRDVTPSPLHFL